MEGIKWDWALSMLGCLGAFGSEFLRWRKIYQDKDTARIMKGISPWLWSLAYVVIGGVFSAVFAGNQTAAVYMGCSWPVFLSGADSYAKGRREEDPTDLIASRGSGLNKFRAFNIILFK